MDKHLTNTAVHLWSLETLNVVFAFIVSGAHSIDTMETQVSLIQYMYTLCSIFLDYLTLSFLLYRNASISQMQRLFIFSSCHAARQLSLSSQNRWLSHVCQLFCPSTSSPRSWRWELSLHRIQDSSEYIFHCIAAAVNGFCRIKVKQGIAEKCF